MAISLNSISMPPTQTQITKYNIGGKFTVIGDSCSHRIPIGTIITKTNDYDSTAFFHDYGTIGTYIRHIDVVPYAGDKAKLGNRKKVKIKVGSEVKILTSDMNYERGFPFELIIHGQAPNFPQKGIIKAISEERLLIEYNTGKQTMCLSFPINAIEGGGVAKTKKKKLQLKYLESLVIKESVKNEIVSTLKQAENHDKIFTKWGLGAVIEYGRGMTFMFHGLPGTGKTYGANLIAKALDTTLLVLSAADIQSSEPGAANRNIEQAFTTAKEKDQVLFIDECDSLIFNRSHLGMVLASEVNTLLTCIEKFEGVCILATNRIADMDAALERRISLIVEFPMPNKEQRLQIWKNLMPKKLPIGELDINTLAEHEISGGMIKNAVLSAARMAAAEKSDMLTPEHFQTAIKRVLSSKNLMGTHKNPQARMDVSTETHTNKTVDIFDNYIKKDNN